VVAALRFGQASREYDTLFPLTPVLGRCPTRRVATQAGFEVIAGFVSRGEFTEWSDEREDLQGPGFRHLPRGWPIEACLRRYRRPNCLWVLGHSRWAQVVAAAVTQGMPEGVRGLFVPCELNLYLGGHDLCEFSEAEEGQLYARASFSVRFFSYHTPNQWQRFRELVFALPGWWPSDRRWR